MRLYLCASKCVKIGYNRLILFTQLAQPANAFTYRPFLRVYILSTFSTKICEAEFVFKCHFAKRKAKLEKTLTYAALKLKYPL